MFEELSMDRDRLNSDGKNTKYFPVFCPAGFLVLPKALNCSLYFSRTGILEYNPLHHINKRVPLEAKGTLFINLAVVGVCSKPCSTINSLFNSQFTGKSLIFTLIFSYVSIFSSKLHGLTHFLSKFIISVTGKYQGYSI